MRRLTTLVAASLIALAPQAAEAQKKQRDVIAREEIEQLTPNDIDLLSALKRIRPHFVEAPRGTRTMGGGMMNPILVVIGNRRGDSQLLETLPARDVREVRYLDPSRAQNEYGIRANGGAIVVKLMNDKEKGPG